MNSVEGLDGAVVTSWSGPETKNWDPAGEAKYPAGDVAETAAGHL